VEKNAIHLPPCILESSGPTGPYRGSLKNFHSPQTGLSTRHAEASLTPLGEKILPTEAQWHRAAYGTSGTDSLIPGRRTALNPNPLISIASPRILFLQRLPRIK